MKKKNILKKIMMYVFVFVLLFMVPAQAQAASVTRKALNKKVRSGRASCRERVFCWV